MRESFALFLLVSYDREDELEMSGPAMDDLAAAEAVDPRNADVRNQLALCRALSRRAPL